MTTQVSIIIITWNHQKYIQKCVESCLNQTLEDFKIIAIDNNSQDGSAELWSKIAGQNEKIKLIKNQDNVGFAPGNNQGIKQARGKYILCLNPDAILAKDFLQKGVEFFQKNEKCGAIAGKLLRYDFDQNQKTSLIDSAGVIVFKNRRAFDRGQGEPDSEKFSQPEEVFGVSAACAFYKREALEDTKINDEYFDQDFFAYKEDVDLSWRLRLYNWPIWYVPECVAYHHRGTGVLSDKSNAWEIMKNRKQNVSRLVKSLSYRNQRLMQIKNELWPGLILHFPWIIIKEAGILVYILLFEQYIFKAVFEIFKYLPRMLKKRKTIMQNRKVGWRELVKWFN